MTRYRRGTRLVPVLTPSVFKNLEGYKYGTYVIQIRDLPRGSRGS